MEQCNACPNVIFTNDNAAYMSATRILLLHLEHENDFLRILWQMGLQKDFYNCARNPITLRSELR